MSRKDLSLLLAHSLVCEKCVAGVPAMGHEPEPDLSEAVGSARKVEAKIGQS